MVSTTEKKQSSLQMELLDCLFQLGDNKTNLQKAVNLLRQFLKADSVVLCAYFDNCIVSSSDDLETAEAKKSFSLELNGKSSFWDDRDFVVPLDLEGKLIVSWENTPSDKEMALYNEIFQLIPHALKMRSLVTGKVNAPLSASIVLKAGEILEKDLSLKEKLNALTVEIANAFKSSRCQIKLFNDQLLNYDTALSAEFVSSPLLEAISVVPQLEEEWLSVLKKDKSLILNKSLSNKVSNIDALLAIKSIFASPIVYKDELIGSIVLHQCDYSKVWSDDEVKSLKELSLLLGIYLGNELAKSKNLLLDSDVILKEVSHLQIKSQISKLPFSLLMIEIDGLRDISLNQGHMASSLVISQVTKYLLRMFGDKYKIARYSSEQFVAICENVNHQSIQEVSNTLRDKLSHFLVLGVGVVDFNFSYVTYPIHASNTQELCAYLEQGMILSKSRGKSQISSIDEVKTQSKSRWKQLVSFAMPEIILKKSSFKTGPDIVDVINRQIKDQENKKSYTADILDSIQSLAIALDAKDSYTEGHSKRVSEYAYLLAKNICLDLQEVEWVRLAACMHDIGKIGIPESILCKNGKLTKEEFEVMKKHPVIGAKILKPIKPLEKVAHLVLHHHEYWNGTGYPFGLKKEEIPVGSRIVSIVDAYQAMTSDRPYRPALPQEEALKRLKDGREKQWDSELIDEFIKIIS